MPLEKEVWKKLDEVLDPELGISIVAMGLIYEVEVRGRQVSILMTLTTPGCPLATVIERMIREKVAEMPGVDEGNVKVEITFDPPWTQDMMTKEARVELGFSNGTGY